MTQLISVDKPRHVLSNETEGYQSFGHIFPAENCFDFQRLNYLISQLKIERIKGVVKTNKGWFIINGSGASLQYIPIKPSTNNRIEIIATQHNFQSTLKKMMHCKVLDNQPPHQDQLKLMCNVEYPTPNLVAICLRVLSGLLDNAFSTDCTLNAWPYTVIFAS
jgi:hypothetical protein